jgi:predicted transcriptional regulator
MGEEGVMGKEKSEALELIKKLPDEVSTGGIMEELYFKQQIDKGLREVAEGRVLSHKELKERMAKWRKSAGR